MDVKCSYCGKEFKKYSNQKRTNHFCSRNCYAKWRSENLKGNNNYNPKAKDSIIKECEYCGRDFRVPKYRIESARFCSQDCKKEHMVGERANGSWKGGTNRRIAHKVRSLKKYKDWVKSVLERDNYECQECGATEHLDVHHVKEFIDILNENNITTTKEAKRCLELWEKKNGITLCIHCHADKHPDLRFLFERRIA